MATETNNGHPARVIWRFGLELTGMFMIGLVAMYWLAFDVFPRVLDGEHFGKITFTSLGIIVALIFMIFPYGIALSDREHVALGLIAFSCSVLAVYFVIAGGVWNQIRAMGLIGIAINCCAGTSARGAVNFAMPMYAAMSIFSGVYGEFAQSKPAGAYCVIGIVFACVYGLSYSHLDAITYPPSENIFWKTWYSIVKVLIVLVSIIPAGYSMFS